MQKCDYLVPNSDDIGAHDEILECVLKKFHNNGEHLVKRSDGRWVAWLRDWECECENEDCGCILWDVISEDAAQKIIAKHGVR